MKNKITLQLNSPTPYEKLLLDHKHIGRFLLGAEEDYILARVLLLMSFNDLGMYHYQQCIEKYLKAFILENNIKFVLKKGHDLDYLRNLCAQKNTFFSDPDLVYACQSVTPFEIIGRYPAFNLYTSYGWSLPEIALFLDEFVFEMMKQVKYEHKGNIIKIMRELGRINYHDFNNFSKSLVDLFFKDNTYFSKT